MGYTTFNGRLSLDKPLTEAHSQYINKFSETRRMDRDPDKTESLPDPVRLAAGLPVGKGGGYYVGDTEGRDVIDSNKPPNGQPGLWCQWVYEIDKDGFGIEWDQNEKFYNYEEWLVYIIDHFLKYWGYTLNGQVEWRGEDDTDLGLIVVKDNVVSTKSGKVTYD